jgi:ABC-type nitrate/sulfonate/bicarbonate transport system substrate-binding protein
MRLRTGIACVLPIALAIAAALAGSGCNDGDASGAGSETTHDVLGHGPTKLTVGLVPVTDVAPVQLGIEKGFFEVEGLDVEIRTAKSGAEIVPQVMSGDVQVGYSSTRRCSPRRPGGCRSRSSPPQSGARPASEAGAGTSRAP